MEADGDVRAGDVLVIGEALIDAVADRPGGPAREHVGGSPANVALGLGRLGVPVRLRTALAPDARGRTIAAHLAASGVFVDPASYCLERTAIARAVTAADGSATYTFDLEWRLPGQVAGRRAPFIHVGSIACFLEPGASALERFLHGVAGSVPVSFDPNIRRQFTGPHAAALQRVERLARLASVVKLSDEDARWLYPGRAAGEVLDRLLRLGPRLAVITAGGGGAVLASHTDRVRVDAVTVPVRDTVGAGDSFMAGLLHRLLAVGTVGTDGIDGTDGPDRLDVLDVLDGPALRRLGRHAVLAASITVSRAGADLPGLADLARAEEQAQAGEGRIASRGA